MDRAFGGDAIQSTAFYTNFQRDFTCTILFDHLNKFMILELEISNPTFSSPPKFDFQI